MKRTTALLAALLVASALAAPGLATAQEASTATFEFHAEPGAHPVNGREGYWSTPEHEVRVWENANRKIVFDENSVSNDDYIRVELAAPGNAPLEVGTYTGVRYLPTATNPGLLVISDGLACGPVHGHFTVHSIERDPVTGRMTDVDLEVEQRCGAPDAPAFSAHVTLSS